MRHILTIANESIVSYLVSFLFTSIYALFDLYERRNGVHQLDNHVMRRFNLQCHIKQCHLLTLHPLIHRAINYVSSNIQFIGVQN